MSSETVQKVKQFLDDNYYKISEEDMERLEELSLQTWQVLLENFNWAGGSRG